MSAIGQAEVDRRIAVAMREAKEDTLRLPEAQNSTATQQAGSQPKITKYDKQVATVLDVVRPLEWALENGQPVERRIKSRESITAALLYRRGVEVARCVRCQTKGPFVRLKFEKSKGDMWAEADTQLVLPNGGLRQTLQLIGEDGFDFLRVNDEDSASEAQELGETSALNDSSPAHQSEDTALSDTIHSSEEQGNLPTGATNSGSEDEAEVYQAADPSLSDPSANETDSSAEGWWCRFLYSAEMPADDCDTLPQSSATQIREEICSYPPAGDCPLALVLEDAEYSIEHEPQKNKQE
ncbi:hypothetical protein AAWM_11049 [Aspergillus awamori]|uniref:Uncharacterized protein n=1 Tax=Aspergillus awamori TaxID=105351 RepID=A0A401L9H3_ASPAW|nr:hypothetical protein AAWM_11049 [Aspergillus awamori]GKZ57512.1 hypothetical protein AnigIFM49718_002829 [Aspergillus niger]GLA42558.1 hypothetical protein AnigIFM63309_011099 [Aspergillus niger]